MTAQILVVEDEAVVAKDIERMLEKRGYCVAAIAHTGERAVQLASETHLDLAVMDIKLGGEIDGIDAAGQLFTKFHIPVVYLTAQSDEDVLQRAKNSRPFGYVLKPVDYIDLYTTVETALNIYSAETKLQESELQLRTILETTLDGFWIFDSQGRFMEVNKAYCKMTGFSRSRLLRMNIMDVDAQETREECLAHLQRIIEHGADRYETRHRCKNGRLIDVEISVNFAAQLGRGFAFLRDITDRKRSGEEIIKLNQDLQRHAQEMMALYQAEREQRELSETMVEASHMLISTLNVNIVLDRIMEQINHFVKNDVCNIMLIDGGNTQVVRTRGYEDFDAGTFIETYVFPLSGLPVRRQIIETGEPIVVPDVCQDNRWMSATGSAWLRSYMAVPITLHNNVIGVINVGISMPNYYSQSHAARLLAFAYNAAIAFQNARLFEEMQQSASQLEVLSKRLLDIQETERRHIARELHDEVGQALTATQLRLQAIRNSPASGSFHTELDECSLIVDNALRQARDLSLDLHPSLLDDLGLVPALRWFVDRESRWGQFTAQVIANTLDKRLPDWCELVCYRVVQEAMTNVTRHAHASHVTVELWQRAGELHLVIRDDGIGFNVLETMQSINQGSSLGLLGMRERLMLVKGKLDIHSNPGSGTEIHARIPIENHYTGSAGDEGGGV